MGPKVLNFIKKQINIKKYCCFKGRFDYKGNGKVEYTYLFLFYFYIQ